MSQRLISATTEENIIDVRFQEDWYQEDIAYLTQLIFTQLPDVNVIEKQLGADRETYRLNIEGNYLTLNFDYYSQSCWIEPESEGDDFMQYAQALTV